MKKIYKYELEITDFQTIKMPIFSKVISAINRTGKLAVYALVETEGRLIDYDFVIIGTGNPVEEDIEQYTFVGTVEPASKMFVWHVFYKADN